MKIEERIYATKPVERFNATTPFKHMIIDNFWSNSELSKVEEAFPKPDDSWWNYANDLEKKRAFDNHEAMPEVIQNFFSKMNSAYVINLIEEMTGMKGLIPDPHLRGGGMHSIEPGGKLDIHVDYNIHPVTKLDRRLNMIIYLNKNWSSLWGGDLELWDAEMRECQVKIEPFFNRTVIFETNEISNHGHPEPLRCPVGITRKSLALYYYSNGRPAHERVPAHSTIFKKRPQDPHDPKLDAFREQRSKGRIPEVSP